MEVKELSRNKAAEMYKAQGFAVKGKVLKGKEYKKQLYSLFLTRYKETLSNDKPQKLQVSYADMAEVITTLMAATKTKFKNNLTDKKQQAINWYKNLSPSKNKLAEARVDLIQKFYELIPMRTEAVKDQLNEMLISLCNLVETHELSFAKVEEMRKTMREKLGGFDKGVYIESVSKIKIADLTV